MIKLEQNKNTKAEICEKILRSLPDWFGIESAIINYIADVQSMKTLVAYDGSEPVGLLALNYHNQFTAEIHVMGIMPQYHRKGIGKKLVFEAKKLLKKEGFKFMSVKTLSESRPNKEYDLTRRFYFEVGFLPVEEFKTLWDEFNPCLFLIKSLA